MNNDLLTRFQTWAKARDIYYDGNDPNAELMQDIIEALQVENVPKSITSNLVDELNDLAKELGNVAYMYGRYPNSEVRAQREDTVKEAFQSKVYELKLKLKNSEPVLLDKRIVAGPASDGYNSYAYEHARGWNDYRAALIESWKNK